jgi:hypothetical protein
MNILDIVSADREDYITICYHGLKVPVDVFTLDFTSGETDISRVLTVDKSYIPHPVEAFGVLIIRLLMVEEEWLDTGRYTKEDIDGWITWLKPRYYNSVYMNNVHLINSEMLYFHLQRYLSSDSGLAGIQLNGQDISTLEYEELCPLATEKIVSTSRSKFNGITEEFYIETRDHYTLFNWYTTA